MDDLGVIGRVASLHIHLDIPHVAGMTQVQKIHVDKGKGIVGNKRYYGKINADGNPKKNHVSIIEREQLDIHCRDLERQNKNLDGSINLRPGDAKSNIETNGVKLLDLHGELVQIGKTAILHFYKRRTPCYQMNEIPDVPSGLEKLMKGNKRDGIKQGAIAEVIESGDIYVGDTIRLYNADGPPNEPINIYVEQKKHREEFKDKPLAVQQVVPEALPPDRNLLNDKLFPTLGVLPSVSVKDISKQAGSKKTKSSWGKFSAFI